jgi:hypothetical protein
MPTLREKNSAVNLASRRKNVLEQLLTTEDGRVAAAEGSLATMTADLAAAELDDSVSDEVKRAKTRTKLNQEDILVELRATRASVSARYNAAVSELEAARALVVEEE